MASRPSWPPGAASCSSSSTPRAPAASRRSTRDWKSCTASERGLVVLGFPCNQFGKQEPGTEAEIGAFCEKNYGVSFPMFAKVDVNGDDAHPLYKHLKGEKPGVLGTEAIKWNFTKFLVARDGEVVKRYAPQTTPAEIAGDIERLLAL